MWSLLKLTLLKRLTIAIQMTSFFTKLSMQFATLYFFAIILLHQSSNCKDLKFATSYHEPEFQRHRFKSLKCISENASIIEFKYCRVKFSRNSTAYAVNITAHRMLQKPLNARLSISYKYGQIYREVFKVNAFEICEVLKNFNLLPPFMKAVFDVVGDSFTILLKGCPFFGDMNLFVTADASKFPSIFPSGMYKTHMYISKPNTELIHVISEVEMISSIRTSF